MHKKLVSLMFVLFVAASVSAQETVRCESSDGKYRECAFNSTSRIVMTRQFSDTNCVEGKNWGYRDGMVWVDAGCRAEFASSQAGGIRPDMLVVCESDNNTRSVCRTPTGGGVAVMRQLSKNGCVRGKTWGYDKNGIWVDNGCRAEFVIGAGNNDRTFEKLDQLVLCESVDGKPARCLADTTGGVQMVRQVSDTNCRYGRQWGYDANGIWVNEGCRAEFAVRGLSQSARAEIRTTMPMNQTMDNHMHHPMPVTADNDRTPGTLLCESENNGRKHCDVDTRYGITLVRQISDNICARDRTWGVDKDGVWVNDGCRGEFMLGHEAPAVSMTSSAQMPPTLVCESVDGKRNHCEVDTSMGVRLYRQMSDSDCLLNSTWGYDANGIWVSGGCRAEFAVGEGRMLPSRNVPQAGRVMCESKDGKRTVCPADTRMGVAVVRQTSDSPCVLNSTWGYNTDGIWVTAGCRAEFILRK
jgi:hypothetical protein